MSNENSLHTESPEVARLWVAWQMTQARLHAVEGETNEDASEAIRVAFGKNYQAVLAGSAHSSSATRVKTR